MSEPMFIMEYDPFEDLAYKPYSERDFTENEKDFINDLSTEFSLNTDEVSKLVLYVKNLNAISDPGPDENELNSIIEYLKKPGQVKSIVFKHTRGSIKITYQELIDRLLEYTLRYNFLYKIDKNVDKNKPLHERLAIRNKGDFMTFKENYSVIRATRLLLNRLLPKMEISNITGKPNKTTASVIICQLYALYDIKFKKVSFPNKELHKKDNITYRKNCDDRINNILRAEK